MVKGCCKLLMSSVLVLTVLAGSSCQLQQVPPEDKPAVPVFNTIAVVGFRPALLPTQEPGLVRSPISGAVFSAEPVSEVTAEGLSNLVFERVKRLKERR